MDRNPISFLQEYMAKRQIMPNYEEIESRIGTHINWFRIRVHCGYETADGEGSSKKIAKMKAATRMIELLTTGAPDEVSSPNVSTTLQVQDNLPSSNSNYITRLQEMAQKKGIPLPVYKDELATGEPHNRTFTTSCTYYGIEEKASASTKKEAKALAAKMLFERISSADPLNHDVGTAQSQVDSNVNAAISMDTTNIGTFENNEVALNMNYIGKLQEIAQQKGAVLPKYTEKLSTGSANAPSFTMVCSYGGFEEEGSGNTKKEAKTSAAKKMFQRIIHPSHSLNFDSQVQLNSYLDTVNKGMKELKICNDNEDNMAEASKKALKLYLPLSKTSATKTVNSEEKFSYSNYHKVLKDSFSDMEREHAYDKLHDLIRKCTAFMNTGDTGNLMDLLKIALKELNIEVKEVSYDVQNKSSVAHGLQLDTNPVISEIGHGRTKSNAVIQTIMQMAVTICILIA